MSVNKQRKKEFLEAIVLNNGEANVTQIRSETGFSRNQIDYWFPQVVEENLVEKEYDDQGRRVAVLTEEGRTDIEKGEYGRDLLEKEDTGVDEITLSQSEFEEFQNRIKTLEQANQAQQERIRELEQNQNYVLKTVGVIQLWVRSLKTVLEDDYSIYSEMEQVADEALQGDDLPPTLEKYKTEQYED